MSWLDWLFVAVALVFAYQAGTELFIVWYSGVEPELPVHVWVLLGCRVALGVLAAACVVVLAILEHRHLN